jgi:hypothetical protein
MLTRRRFASFASCAICGITEFIATEASAQGAPAATTPGVARKDFVADRRSDAGLYDDPRGSDHRCGGAGRAPHASGNRIRLCLGGRLRASHPRSTHPHDPSRRWLPNPTGHAPCGRQTRQRQEQDSHHVCRGEGKAHRLSSLRAHAARARLPRKGTPRRVTTELASFSHAGSKR